MAAPEATSSAGKSLAPIDPRRSRWLGALLALMGAVAIALAISLPVDAFSHSTDKYVHWVFGLRKLGSGPEAWAAIARTGVLVAPAIAWAYAARDVRLNPDGVGIRFGLATWLVGAYVVAYTFAVAYLTADSGSLNEVWQGLVGNLFLALIPWVLGLLVPGPLFALIVLPAAIVWGRVLRRVLAEPTLAAWLDGRLGDLADRWLGTWRVAVVAFPIWVLVLYLYLAETPTPQPLIP
ncbi:MAG: hypothetical protein ACRDFZ_05720 [Candidatus Limnocylindria bacterium]